MQTVAVVLARGGSKRLPGKNMRKIGGRSLVARAVQAGTEAVLVDRVILSTDDGPIADEGALFGAEVPFIRPDSLSGDDATSAEAVLHALDACGISDGVLVLLQPTSPLRSAHDVDDVLRFKARENLPCVVTTSPEGKPNGAVYAIDVPLFLKARTFYPDGKVSYFEMPAVRSIDVDTDADFQIAEAALLAPVDWDG